MTDALLVHPLIETLGRMLLHFLWQGALVAGALALALRLMHRRPATERYAAALVALLLMVALPPATWVVLSPAPASEAGERTAPAVATSAAPAPSTSSQVGDHFFSPADKALPVEEGREKTERTWAEVATAQVRRWAGTAAPWIALGWMIGVAGLALRMAGGWFSTRRMRQRAGEGEEARWKRRFVSLARQMGLRRVPRLLRSDRLEGPVTVGWIRPTVLVPTGFLTGMPPAQVEAILRHELAHIRRYDYLAALAQAVIETLLFYHPAVWWVSGRVRSLREHCCDERAARLAESRLTYARALTELEAGRSARLMLSAADGDLFERIRRVVEEPSTHYARPGRLVSAFTVLLLAAVIAVAACAPRAVNAQEEPAPRTETAAVQGTQGTPKLFVQQSAVPSDTVTRLRVVSAQHDTTRLSQGPTVISINADTLRLDSLDAAHLGVDSEKWQRWGEQWQDWGERFEEQWTADSSQWKAWAERWEDWGDSLEVSLPDSPPVPKHFRVFPDSFEVHIPEPPAVRGFSMKGWHADSVVASVPPLDGLRNGAAQDILALRRLSLPFAPDTLPSLLQTEAVEKRALRQAADRLEERAEALNEGGQEEAADAVREEAERLREEAEEAGEDRRRIERKHRERLKKHRQQMERRRRLLRGKVRQERREALRGAHQRLRRHAKRLSARAEEEQTEMEALRERVEKLREEEASDTKIEALQEEIQALEKRTLALKEKSRELRRRADRLERQNEGEERTSDDEQLRDIE